MRSAPQFKFRTWSWQNQAQVIGTEPVMCGRRSVYVWEANQSWASHVWQVICLWRVRGKPVMSQSCVAGDLFMSCERQTSHEPVMCGRWSIYDVWEANQWWPGCHPVTQNWRYCCSASFKPRAYSLAAMHQARTIMCDVHRMVKKWFHSITWKQAHPFTRQSWTSTMCPVGTTLCHQ